MNKIKCCVESQLISDQEISKIPVPNELELKTFNFNHGFKNSALSSFILGVIGKLPEAILSDSICKILWKLMNKLYKYFYQKKVQGVHLQRENSGKKIVKKFPLNPVFVLTTEKQSNVKVILEKSPEEKEMRIILNITTALPKGNYLLWLNPDGSIFLQTPEQYAHREYEKQENAKKGKKTKSRG